MIRWLVALRPHFDEALPLIARTAPQKIDHLTFFKIGKSNLPAEHPIATGRLIATLLEAATEPDYSCDEIYEAACKAAIAGAAADDVAAIVYHLTRLRCEEAAKKLKAMTQ